MKKIYLTLILLFLVPICVNAGEYLYEKYHFKMTFPSSYYIIDIGNVDDSKAFIESYGISLENIKNIFENSDQVTVGIKSNEEITMYVKIIEDRTSKWTWNLHRASKKRIAALQKTILDNIEGTYEIVTQEQLEINDILFIKTKLRHEAGHYQINYHTIHNGKHYEINFLSFGDGETKCTIEEISSIQKEAFNEINEIINSFKFTETLRAPVNLTIVITLLLVFIAVMSVIGIRKNKKKLKNEDSNWI